MLSICNTPHHLAALGQRKDRDDMTKAGRHLVRGEKGITKERHGGDDIGIIFRRICITLGQEGQSQSNGRKDCTVQKENQE